jgi:transaldolase
MSTITELNPRLLALTEAGVSVWLDQIRRSMVEGGELARMVSVESLRGVTSNPAIFEKAILGSTRPRSTSGSRSGTSSSPLT